MAKKTTSQEIPIEPEGIEARIRPIKEAVTLLKILVYGRSGTGKTTFLGTAPGPLLVLDIREEGTVSIRNKKEGFVISIENWDDFEELYYYLVENPLKYKTVAVDTITPLQDLAIRKVTGGDTSTISQRSWGEASGLMKTWIMLYRDLPMNVIFTAQDRQSGGESEDINDDGTINPEVGPWCMPSVAKILNAAVGVIGQTYIRERTKILKLKGGGTTEKTVTEYAMRIGPHSRYVTKLRRDQSMGEVKTPAVLVNPTFEEILRLTLEADV